MPQRDLLHLILLRLWPQNQYLRHIQGQIFVVAIVLIHPTQVLRRLLQIMERRSPLVYTEKLLDGHSKQISGMLLLILVSLVL